MGIATRSTTALVTGASSGLGTEFARAFAKRGADVVLVARREQRLQALAEHIRATYGVAAHVIALDLAAPGAAAALRAEVDDLGIRVDHVVNNAGFGVVGAFVESDVERLHELLQLNVHALVDVTRVFLPDLVARGSGTVLNVASTAGYQPTPSMAVYGASKAFVLQFTESLVAEVAGSGVTVLALSPGPTRTEFLDVAGVDAMADPLMQSSRAVVDTAFRALDRTSPPPSVVSGWRNRVLATVTRLLPRRATVRLMGRVLGDVRERREPVR